MNYSSINRFPGGDWDWEDDHYPNCATCEDEGYVTYENCQAGDQILTETIRCPDCEAWKTQDGDE